MYTSTIAHLSDVHFGRITHPDIVDAVVREVNALGVDLVVVSGDLTQRALPSQFRAAKALLEAFDAPSLVVPGNHDVYAYWRPWLRIFKPVVRFQQMITDNLYPIFERQGLKVLGINSAFGRTIKHGLVKAQDCARIRAAFSGVTPETYKVLVVHHHLQHLDALTPHDIVFGAEAAMEAVVEAGVDLILCGHLHVSHVEATQPQGADKPLIVASAGTATSNRGREDERQANLYNIIRIDDRTVDVEERKFDLEARAYRPERRSVFPRAGAPSRRAAI